MGRVLLRPGPRILVTFVLTAASLPANAGTDPEICHQESGDIAIEACNRVINSGRYSTEDLSTAYVNRAHEYYVKRDYDRAISDNTQALRVNPRNSVAYANRGNAWSAKKEATRALADYDEAIRLDSEYTAAFTSRGRVKRDAGDTPGAIADFRRALALPPKHQNGQWAHDEALRQLKELGVTP